MVVKMVFVWDMTDEELERESATRRRSGEIEHADELLLFRDIRKERCPCCNQTWEQLNMKGSTGSESGLREYSSHISRCVEAVGSA